MLDRDLLKPPRADAIEHGALYLTLGRAWIYDRSGIHHRSGFFCHRLHLGTGNGDERKSAGAHVAWAALHLHERIVERHHLARITKARREIVPPVRAIVVVREVVLSLPHELYRRALELFCDRGRLDR